MDASTYLDCQDLGAMYVFFIDVRVREVGVKGAWGVERDGHREGCGGYWRFDVASRGKVFVCHSCVAEA